MIHVKNTEDLVVLQADTLKDGKRFCNRQLCDRRKQAETAFLLSQHGYLNIFKYIQTAENIDDLK